MKELEALAEKVKNELKLDYDAKSVKFIEGFIERQRKNFSREEHYGLVNTIGSFIGQCIIKNYGGYWQFDETEKTVCVALDEKNKIFPFAKTAKQFANGLGDSVYSFYSVIPFVFKINSLPKAERTDDLQILKSNTKSKKWWKFW